MTYEDITNLAARVAAQPGVRAVGVTKLDLPKPGEGDVDMMVYCDSVPDIEARKALFPEARVRFFGGERWGDGDLLMLDGVEVFIMYFSYEDAIDDIESIMIGTRAIVEPGGFYITGRLAMYKNMIALADDGCIANLKEMCEEYPDSLRKSILKQCANILSDVETFERAVTRKEVLLYHAELEKGLDALLQALFALNRVLFPSRKRSLEYMKDFVMIPENCGARLLEIIALGAQADTLIDSYEKWRALVAESKRLIDTARAE